MRYLGPVRRTPLDAVAEGNATRLIRLSLWQQ